MPSWKFWNSFSYSPVASHNASANDPTIKLQPHFWEILKSKRVRIVGIATFAAAILVFVALGPKMPPIQTDWHFPSTSQSLSSPVSTCLVDWSRFAYIQYVTNTPYLCNSVMLFEILHRLGSKADRLMMYPANFDPVDQGSAEGRLLMKAKKSYGVKLMPIEVQHKSVGDSTWAESFTKLLAFNQTQYDRVLSLDSDSTILQTMDELFLLPPCPVAIPRAYWLDPKDHVLSSQLVLIQPSKLEFDRVMKGIETAGQNEFDMEIVNNLYKDNAMILPHRPYDLLTGEFRSKDHVKYLGNDIEPWDPEKILKEGKFLHFSDWPVSKPWIADPGNQQAKKPTCDKDPQTGKEDCRAQEIWLGFYSDFALRRKEICGIEVRKRDITEEVSRPHRWEAVI